MLILGRLFFYDIKSNKMETLEIVKKVDPKEYGLEAEKVKSIEDAFTPKITERDLLKTQYEELISKELTEDICGEAKVLRLKFVKVRTGISDIHKTQKSFFLASGKFVDAWKNKETLPVTQMEDKLTEIENHFEKLEEERKAKLRESRLLELAKYDNDGEFMDLVNMPPDAFDTYLAGAKTSYNAKIEAQRLEEEEELRLEAIQDLHDVRTNDLYDSGLWTFANKTILNKLGELCDSDYKDIRDDALKARKEHEAEQVRIKKENERLKKEADERVKQEKIELDKRAEVEAERNTKEEKERKIREQKQATEKAIAGAKLKEEQEKSAEIAEELRLKKEADQKAEDEKKAQIESDLNKGDAQKVIELIVDLDTLKTKYKFKSKKNQKMYSQVGGLLDKVVGHISKK